MTELDITGAGFIKVSGVVMDLEAHTVRRGKNEIKLNRKELMLLEYLMRNAGSLVTEEKILKNVWGDDYEAFTNTVAVHISFLRKKIDGGFDEKLIQTVHGYGYKFDVQ